MITTDRLVLRPYELTDAGALREMNSDPTIERFPPGTPMTEEDAWNRLLRYVGHWTLLGYGVFAVIERTSGRYIGETGLSNFKRGLGPDFDGFDEASWFFTGASQGRGYAIEATRAVHDWHAHLKGEQRTVCMIDPNHSRSISLAQKMGYRAFRNGEYKSSCVAMFERGGMAGDL
jgi:RimJ/RimL family protein N-acetyltransferase